MVEEENSLVLFDRTPEGGAEDVVAQLRAGLMPVLDGGKEAWRIHGVVAQEFVGASMKLVGAGFGGLDNHATG